MNTTIDLILGDVLMHNHEVSSIVDISSYYLKLDQSTPQTTVGTFTFPSVIATNYLKTPKIYPSADSTTAIQILKANGTTSILNVDTTNGRVGIGTTAPTSALTVVGAVTASSLNVTHTIGSLGIYNNSIYNQYGDIQLNAGNVGGAGLQVIYTPYQVNGLKVQLAATNQAVQLQTFGTDSNVNLSIMPKGTGNVGIGTTAPAGRLHINGTVDDQQLIVEAHSTQTANLAEWRNSSGTVQTALAGNGRDFVLDSTTGSKIGTATTQKLGFWNKTPVIQQVTNAYTSDSESVAYTGIDNAQAGTPYAQVTDLNALRTAYETLRASYDDLLTKLRNTGVIA